MMFSNEFNTISLIKNQYKLKLKAYSHFFSILVLTEALILLISLGGIGSGSYGSEFLLLEYNLYSSILFYFVVFCNVIGVAFSLVSREARNMDFSFISSRLTSNISSALVLFSFCVFIGIVTTLFSFALRVAVFYIASDTTILTGLYVPFDLLITGILSCTFYTFLVGSIAYFICNVFEFNKVLVVIFPMLLALILLGVPNSVELKSIFAASIEFLVNESSILLFVLKILVISLLLLTCGGLLTNRIEVRK